MLKTRNHYSAISNHQMNVDERFTKGVPSLLPKCILKPGTDYDCDEFEDKEDTDDPNAEDCKSHEGEPAPPDPETDAPPDEEEAEDGDGHEHHDVSDGDDDSGDGESGEDEDEASSEFSASIFDEEEIAEVADRLVLCYLVSSFNS